MTILAIDTSGPTLGVALVTRKTVEAELVVRAGRRTSSLLPRLVHGLLADACMDVGDLEAISVTLGPGSFTGLRIGVGFAVGLALARDLPAVGVSSSRALAASAQGVVGRHIVSAISAGRGGGYFALYRKDPGAHDPCALQELISPGRHSAKEFLNILHTKVYAAGEPVWVCDDAKAIEGEMPGDVVTLQLRPGVVGQLGWRKLDECGPTDLSDLHPRYHRKSGAERGRAKQ